MRREDLRHMNKMRRVVPAVLLSAALAGGLGAASRNPGSGESVCQRSDVLFCDDWEDGDHVGWDWSNGWDSCTTIADAGGYQSRNALKQHIGANLAECGYPSSMIPPQSGPIYMRWFVKFGPGYQFLDWTDQKNNYFRALVNGNQTWRMMLGIRAKSSSERGLGEWVVDAMGHDPRWYFNATGDSPGGAAPRYVAPGTWYCIEYAIRPNTPGQSDGWVKVWLNDQVYMSHLNQNLKSTGDPITQAPWFSHYYGGNPPGTHPDIDLWYDNVVVAKERIGCSSTVTTGEAAPPDVTNVRRTDTSGP